MNSHREKYRIHTFEVAKDGTAHPHHLFSLLLDIASLHVEGSQFSYEALHSEGLLWVLSRFYIVFHKLPKWNDDVVVETWGKGINKLFGLRDFIITSVNGNKIVSATSAWLLIDRKTSRPQRLDKLKENFPFQSDRYELNYELEKLAALTSGIESAKYTVHHTDIDLNWHLNSTKYVQWILDSFPPEIINKKIPHTIELNFLAEAQTGEHLSVSIENINDYYFCEIKRVDDNIVLCRAKISWKELWVIK